MSDCLKKSRIGSGKWHYSLIIFFISFTLFFLAHKLLENPQEELLYYLISIGITSVPLCSVFCYKYIVYLEGTKNIKRAFKKCIDDVRKNHQTAIGVSSLFFCALIFLCVLKLGDECPAGTAVAAFLFYLAGAFLLTGIYLLFDYDDAEISCSQNWEKSIGALWAIGAYKAYYENILKDIIERMKKFEKEHGIELKVKKLVVICPLSCKIEGSLKSDDEQISFIGDLEPFFYDQGANVNRCYKQSVFAIKNNKGEDIHIVAEYASPLGTLWKKRFSMDKAKLQYHRDCLIQSFTDLLQNYPCIVLKYDDLGLQKKQSLSEFLLSSLDKLSEERNKCESRFCDMQNL